MTNIINYRCSSVRAVEMCMSLLHLNGVEPLSVLLVTPALYTVTSQTVNNINHRVEYSVPAKRVHNELHKEDLGFTAGLLRCIRLYRCL